MTVTFFNPQKSVCFFVDGFDHSYNKEDRVLTISNVDSIYHRNGLLVITSGKTSAVIDSRLFTYYAILP